MKTDIPPTPYHVLLGSKLFGRIVQHNSERMLNGENLEEFQVQNPDGSAASERQSVMFAHAITSLGWKVDRKLGTVNTLMIEFPGIFCD